MSDGKIIIEVSINENGILEIGGKQMSNGKVIVDVVINEKENLVIEQKFREAITDLIEKGIETKNPATIAVAAEIYKTIKK